MSLSQHKDSQLYIFDLHVMQEKSHKTVSYIEHFLLFN